MKMSEYDDQNFCNVCGKRYVGEHVCAGQPVFTEVRERAIDAEQRDDEGRPLKNRAKNGGY